MTGIREFIGLRKSGQLRKGDTCAICGKQHVATTNYVMVSADCLAENGLFRAQGGDAIADRAEDGRKIVRKPQTPGEPGGKAPTNSGPDRGARSGKDEPVPSKPGAVATRSGPSKGNARSSREDVPGEPGTHTSTNNSRARS